MTLEEGVRSRIAAVAAVILPIFALAEINYPHLRPQSQLAIFAGLGLTICFLGRRRKLGEHSALAAFSDVALAALAIAVCSWIVVQTEPFFETSWLLGSSLGDRAGAETGIDFLLGAVGLIVVLEATRRTIGWVLPALAGTFLVYAYMGACCTSN